MLHAELFERIASIALGRPWEPLLSAGGQTATDHPLRRFIGEYQMEDGVKVTITSNGDGLFLKEEGLPGRFKIHPINERTGYVIEPYARLRFTPAGDGKPASLDALFGVLLWTGERERHDSKARSA